MAATKVVAASKFDKEVGGSASDLRWKGLAGQPAIGEIIGEADDEKLLGVKVDDGDDGLLLPTSNVAAPANVHACGRRLVFLVTHILR